MKMLYKNQFGRLMIEMIVVLGLLALFAPMIYRTQVEKREREANVTNAQQILQIVAGVDYYMTQNATTIAAGGKVGDVDYAVVDENTEFPDKYEISLKDAELEKYLPIGLSGVSNKLFQSYRVAVARNRVSPTTPVVVSAMVVAIPRSPLGPKRLADISSMLGAAGGRVSEETSGGNNVIGNSSLWETKTGDYFSSSVAVGSVAANIDYYVPSRIGVTGGGVSTMEDPGYMHKTDTSKEVDVIDGKEYDVNTMQVDLEMGTGSDEDDASFSLKNVDGVYAGKHDETCEINSDHCIQKKFNNNMGGQTEMGADCSINDSCISVNGKLKTEAYMIKPSGDTMFEDIRIGRLRGVKLSELIPPMILLEVKRGIKKTNNVVTMSAGNNCPTGYVPVTAVVPTNWEGTTSAAPTANPWPFYALNFKNNKNDSNGSVFFWGSGYACADMHFSDKNALLHYLDGDKVRVRSYVGNAAQSIGGERADTSTTALTISSIDSTSFLDTSFSGANCMPSGATSGKLNIQHQYGHDHCGMSNLSAAFACNGDILTLAAKDFHSSTQTTDLLRWEFYSPPSYMRHGYGGIDLFAYTTPQSASEKVTYPDGTSKTILQTKKWVLMAESDKVTYDVYIYCKYVPHAFQ